jgi:hypothetical protein
MNPRGVGIFVIGAGMLLAGAASAQPPRQRADSGDDIKSLRAELDKLQLQLRLIEKRVQEQPVQNPDPNAPGSRSRPGGGGASGSASGSSSGANSGGGFGPMGSGFGQTGPRIGGGPAGPGSGFGRGGPGAGFGPGGLGPDGGSGAFGPIGGGGVAGSGRQGLFWGTPRFGVGFGPGGPGSGGRENFGPPGPDWRGGPGRWWTANGPGPGPRPGYGPGPNRWGPPPRGRDPEMQRLIVLIDRLTREMEQLRWEIRQMQR